MRCKIVIGLLLGLATIAHAAKEIHGRVIDANTGDGIARASVHIDNTLSGTIADAAGRFTLTLWQLPAVIAVTHVAYQLQRIVIAETTEDTLTVKMMGRTYELNEIVVTPGPSYLRRFTFEGGTDGDWSPDGRRIAFVSTRSGSPEIWVKPVSGTPTVRYTDLKKWACSPTWSPDGKHLAFVSERGGALNIWTMTAEGDSLRPVTADSDRVHDGKISKATRSAGFSWSPDSREIVFARRSRDTLSPSFRWLHGDWRIPWTGGTAVPMTDEGDYYSAPLWSPDGKHLAFSDRARVKVAELSEDRKAQKIRTMLPEKNGARYASGWSPDGKWLAFNGDGKETLQSDMWVIRVKDRKVIQLTHTPTRSESRPRWSPDGRRLIFGMHPSGYDLWVMPASGGHPVRLAECVESADWSPDKKEIGFVAYTDEGKDIFRMPVQGGEWRPVTSGGKADGRGAGLSWSPDGTAFAVIANRSLNWNDGLDLWTIPATGGKRKRLDHFETVGWFDEYRPRWSPDGTQIIFSNRGFTAVVSTEGGKPQSRTLKREDTTDLARRFGIDTDTEALPGESEPTWSPDGQWIAFTFTEIETAEDGSSRANQSIWIAPSSGGEPRRLIKGCAPEWSPDGQEILFIPEWSPDNPYSTLYKESTNKGNDAPRSLWKISVKGGNPVPIIERVKGLRGARWSPDGQSILFLSQPESDLWIMDLESTKFKPYIHGRK